MERGNAPFVVSKSAEIGAPADRLYGIIADYRNGHPRILPPAFTELTVEAGGVGAGTRIRVGMRMLGRVMTFPAEVSEPDPGRVLVERNLGERPVDALAQQLVRVRVDRHDAKAGGLQLRRHLVRGLARVAARSDHGDGRERAQDLLGGIHGGYRVLPRATAGDKLEP